VEFVLGYAVRHFLALLARHVPQSGRMRATI
jgi:hypothetical protein